MRVAVFLGGPSKEKEISKRSGLAVAAALKSRGHSVAAIDPAEENWTRVLDTEKAEVAFIALHGIFGEDGQIQKILEEKRIPYTGPSPEVSALCFDKIATKERVSRLGVPTPDYLTYRAGEDLAAWLKNFSLALPVIVKPNTEGSTLGMTRVHDKPALEAAVREALHYDRVVLVEKNIIGREVTVSVLNYRPLSIVEIIPASGFYDFAAKYTPGKTTYRVPAPLPGRVAQALQDEAVRICREIQCEGSPRVDTMLDAAMNPWFLEINTIPGMTETSLLPKAAQDAGLGFADLCEEILKSGRLK